MTTSRLQALLAILITLMVAGIGAFFALKPPDATNQLLITMVSTILTVFVMVFSYFFGSSPGSKDKDETIKQMAINNAPSAEPEKPAVPATKLTSVSSG